MDLARAPCRAPLTARKMGSGYENGQAVDLRRNSDAEAWSHSICIPVAFLPKNMATAMNARKAYYKKQYILHLQKQIILKLS